MTAFSRVIFSLWQRTGFSPLDTSAQNTTLVPLPLPPQIWNFASQGLLNVSLLFTDAMRASFITQTAIVLTPVISSLRGQKVSKMTWVGCAFALAGVASLASDTGGQAAAAAATVAKGLNIGDCLALGGAS